MDSKTFSAVVKAAMRDASEILELKGNNYAYGEDRLANFKRAAEKSGISPLQAWNVYFVKHLDAIHSFIQGKWRNDGEPIDKRFEDAINYLLLGLALVYEEPETCVHLSGRFLKDVSNLIERETLERFHAKLEMVNGN